MGVCLLHNILVIKHHDRHKTEEEISLIAFPLTQKRSRFGYPATERPPNKKQNARLFEL